MPQTRRHRPARPRAAEASNESTVLTRLAQRVASGEDDLSTAQLTSARNIFKEYATASSLGLSAFLSYISNPMVADAMALYALALRRSGSGVQNSIDESTRASYRKIRILIAEELTKLFDSSLKVAPLGQLPARKRLVLSLVLSTHVLRCYSALLTGAAEQLKQRVSHRNVDAAAEALQEAGALLHILGIAFRPGLWITHAVSRRTPFHADDDRPRPLDTQDEYSEALIAELRTSQLFNSWAACYLELLRCGDWDETDAARTLQRFCASALQLRPPHGSQPLTYPHRSTPLPELQYLLSLLLVRTAAHLDGGRTYGLPPEAPGVPVFGPKGELVRPEQPGVKVASAGLLWALETWQEWYACALRFVELGPNGPVPPPGAADGAAGGPGGGLRRLLPPFQKAATLDLCIRIAAAAVQSFKTMPGRRANGSQAAGSRGAGASGSTSSSSAAGAAAAEGTGPGALLVHRECSSVMHAALQTAYEVIDMLQKKRLARGGAGGGGAGGGDGDLAARSLAAVWRVYVEGQNAAMDWVLGPQDRGDRAEMGSKGWEQDVLMLRELGWKVERIRKGIDWEEYEVSEACPLHPCVTTTAALAARVVPCAERMLRAFTCDAIHFLPEGSRQLWHELLLFSPLEETAALVATLAKALQCNLVQAVPCTPQEDWLVHNMVPASSLLSVIGTLLCWPAAVFDVEMLCSYAAKRQALDAAAAAEEEEEDEKQDGASGSGGGNSAGAAGSRSSNGVASARGQDGAGGGVGTSSNVSDLGSSSGAAAGLLRDSGDAGADGRPEGSGGGDGDGDGGAHAGDPGGRGGPGRTFVLLWSLASVRLLPQVAQTYPLLVRMGKEWQRRGMSARLDATGELGKLALSWCEVLLAAYLRAQVAAAEAVEAAAQWRRLLLEEVGLMPLLAAAMTSMRSKVEDDQFGFMFVRVFRMACAAFPYLVREVLKGAGPAATGTRPSPSGLVLKLQDVLWLTSGLECYTEEEEQALEGLRTLLPQMIASWSQPPLSPRDALLEVPHGVEAAAALLVAPGRALALMREHCCGNPACTNLCGASERALPRRRCGGGCGGAVWYCRKECQVAHWRAGHGAECGRRGGGAAAGGAAAGGSGAVQSGGGEGAGAGPSSGGGSGSGGGMSRDEARGGAGPSKEEMPDVIDLAAEEEEEEYQQQPSALFSAVLARLEAQRTARAMKNRP